MYKLVEAREQEQERELTARERLVLAYQEETKKVDRERKAEIRAKVMGTYKRETYGMPKQRFVNYR